MKTALITTTINVPHVLKLYRALAGEWVKFFVAGDLKTPPEAEEFCRSLGALVSYLSPEAQKALNYKCSEILGWNTIARRNIALLEALKWGADIIVTIDDDNIPINSNYFYHFERIFAGRFHGLQAFGNWFDVGDLLVPKAPHRGFPHDKHESLNFAPVTNVKIGVAAGICLGDPDIGAVERIANHPIVHGVSEVLQAGIVVEPGTWTVFNSQNTAFTRELAPCFLMCPQFERYDDIFASLIAQRVMRDRGQCVHFGHPFVWQQRNQHDLVDDLRAELFGMDSIDVVSYVLDKTLLPAGSVLEQVRYIYSCLGDEFDLTKAWCDDLEKVM